MKVTGVNKVVVNLGRIVREDIKIIDRELEETAWATHKKARANTPVDTGFLRSRWNMLRKKLFYTVINNVRYAGAVEFGRRDQRRAGRFMLTHAFNSEARMLKNRLKRIFR